MNQSDLIVYTGKQEVDEIIDMLAYGAEEIRRRKWAECRMCGFKARGETLGEILQKLGEHGEMSHDE